MDRFPESVSDLAKRPTPTGWPTARARHIAASALCSSCSASAPCSGQATTPAEIAIRSPPARSSSSSWPSSRSAICTASTVCRLGASTQSASSSSRKASSTRRMLSRSAAPTIASTVSWPSPASPLRASGPGGVEDGEREGVAVAAVGLDHLVEPAPHVAGPVEAGQLAVLLGGRLLAPVAGAAAGRCGCRLLVGRVDRGRGDRAEIVGQPLGGGGELLAAPPGRVPRAAWPAARPAGPRPRGRSGPPASRSPTRCLGRRWPATR